MAVCARRKQGALRGHSAEAQAILPENITLAVPGARVDLPQPYPRCLYSPALTAHILQTAATELAWFGYTAPPECGGSGVEDTAWRWQCGPTPPPSPAVQSVIDKFQRE